MLKVIHHLDRQIDALFISEHIEEIVVDGVAHVVLGDAVGPDVNDVMGLDDVDDGERDGGSLILADRLAIARHQDIFQDAEKRLTVIVPLDGVRHLPSAILVRHLAGQIDYLPQIFPLRQSHGPVFDRRGRLIGVAVGKMDTAEIMKKSGTLPEDMNFGIKAGRVVRFLGKPMASEKATTQEMSLEDLYQQMLPRAVLIAARK